MKLKHVCNLCKKSGTIHEKCEEYYEIKANIDKYNEATTRKNRFVNYKDRQN